MKIGIIIVCHNNANDITKPSFVHQIKKCDHIEFCLIDNKSKDHTLECLYDIKEASNHNISIVELKKYSTTDSAVRAAARYMFNQFNLKHIGYLNASEIDFVNQNLSSLIATIAHKKDFFIAYNNAVLKKRNHKTVLLKGVFSVLNYLKTLKQLKPT